MHTMLDIRIITVQYIQENRSYI